MLAALNHSATLPLLNVFVYHFLLKALVLNSKSKGKTTAGELVNLMSVDAQRLMELTTYINSLWSSPFQIGVSLYFLYNTLGLPILAGLGVMVLIIPLNMFLGSRMGSYQVQCTVQDQLA